MVQIAISRFLDSLRVPPLSVNEIAHGKRGITADAALRLGQCSGIDPQFWLNLQARYELQVAEEEIAEQIAAVTPLEAA